MVANFDAKGVPLSGGKNYKLTLPPNIPAANFWSVTLYDAENSSGLDNGQPFPSLGSRDKPVANADGSIDLYFGAKAPAGKEKNWMAIVPGRGLLRHHPALQPDRSSVRRLVEAKRPRGGECHESTRLALADAA